MQFALQMVKHPINHHPGHGHVEPKRKGHARHRPMFIELSPERKKEHHHHQRDNDYSKYGVGNQNQEIDKSHPVVSRERSHTMEKMVNQIGNQEKRGGAAGTEHANRVCRHRPLADEQIP